MYNKYIKRFLDITFSIILIVILLPLLIIISLTLYIKYNKIIYKQERSGINNKVFNMYKFITVYNNKTDRFGLFLRRFKLDALSQLINIIKGEMSFIGPRPLVLEYYKQFNDYQKNRLKVLPGITGYAQINGRNILSVYEKIENHIYYVNNVSFKLDLYILIKTITCIFKYNYSSDENNNIEKEITYLKNYKLNYNPLVSIVIANYNKEKYIKKCIDSVLNQTYKNYEIIIVDDASTDRCVSIIKKIKNDKIKLIINKKNMGIAYSRNRGIKLAKGKYLCFLDSDDYWDKNKLKIQLNYMIQNNLNFTFMSYYFTDEYENILKKVNVPHMLNYKKALKNTIIWTSTVMINVDNIKKKNIYMPNIKRGQDAACWFQILKLNNRAYGLNKALSYYRRYNTSVSANKLVAVKRTWNIYRNVEKFGIIKSSYYFVFYLTNAILKRL